MASRSTLRPHPLGERPLLFMRIVVNGRDMDVTEGLSIDDLLRELGVKREYTAVAVNRDIMPKSAYGETVLRPGDKVEIVRPMGGG
jgi:thiamine biosynthesis protein ThiS